MEYADFWGLLLFFVSGRWCPVAVILYMMGMCAWHRLILIIVCFTKIWYMKTVRVVCLSVLGWLLCVSFCSAQSYTYLWKQVEQAREKSLPQTVIKLAEEICRKAEKEQNAPQLLKGTVCLQAYRESRTPDSLYTHLRNLEQWAADETNPASRAIVHSLLAERYADYLQNHRGTLLSRTELDVEQVPADIREWTPALFVEKVDSHLRASLDNPSLLADTRTTAYLPFVIQEENSALYGHDLLHLLARRGGALQPLADFCCGHVAERSCGRGV